MVFRYLMGGWGGAEKRGRSMCNKKTNLYERIAGWLVVGWVGWMGWMGLGKEAISSSTPPSTTVAESKFHALLKTVKGWQLTCDEWRGVVSKKSRLAGLPVLAQTEVKLHVIRQLAYAISGPCRSVAPSCQQCDRCSTACIDGKPWALNIVETRVKTITLAESLTVQGFPFKEGTRLTFRKNGTLKSAALQSPQTVASRKLQKQMHLNKGTNIAFIPAPDRTVWKVPKIKLFQIGKFECFYTGDDLAVVCSF